MRKQEFRRGTASYRLAKAQGRLPEKKGKPIKKVISNIGKALGSLTGRKDLSATRTNVGEGTVLKRPDITGEQAIAKFQELKSGKPSTTKKNTGTKTFKPKKTTGKSGPRATAGKNKKIAIEKWKDSKPQSGDYTGARGKQTPSGQARFQKDLAAWKAKDPRNK